MLTHNAYFKRKEKVTQPMREQFKRILSFAAALCMLHGISAASCPNAFADAFTLTASAAAAEAVRVQEGQSASFAAKVQNIEAGACGLYADRNGTPTGQSLAIGTYMNKYQTYFVRTSSGQGWNGMQCYIYAQGVYSMLFDALPLNGGSESARTETVLRGPSEITPEVLRNARVMPGAYLRTTANPDGSFNGSNGHSLIILGYNDTHITVLEGNADGNGYIREATMTYDEFAHQFTKGFNRTVTHIIQPEESVYMSLYGMTFENAPSVTAAATTAATATTTAATTTTETTTVTTTTVTTTTTTVTTTTTTTAATTAAEVSTTAAETTAPADTTVALAAETEQLAAPIAELPPQRQVVYTADPITVSRKGTKVALFVPDAKAYTWESSDPDVAAVDESGRVSIKGDGEALITAEYDRIRYEFPVSVSIISWAQLGDVDMDGCVSTSDAQTALKVYVETLLSGERELELTPMQFRLLDVDDNGVVGVEDAQLILKFYVEYNVSGNGNSPMETWERLLNL